MSKHVREKSGKLYLQYSKFQKGHNSHKNWRKLTTLKLDLYYIKTKSYTKFQLNMSKHVGEKCGKLCISSILSSKRGIPPLKIDANWRHSNLICSTVKKKSYAKFKLNMSKHVSNFFDLKGQRHDWDQCLFTKIIWHEILIEFLQKVIQKFTNHFGKDWAINRAEITHKSLYL